MSYTMMIYDPHACTVRDLNDCEFLQVRDGYIPVKSLKEQKWFALHFATGHSVKLEDSACVQLREDVRAHVLMQGLQALCQSERDDPTTPTGSDMDDAVPRALSGYGAALLERVRVTLAAEGYTSAEFARALVRCPEPQGGWLTEAVDPRQNRAEKAETVDLADFVE